MRLRGELSQAIQRIQKEIEISLKKWNESSWFSLRSNGVYSPLWHQDTKGKPPRNQQLCISPQRAPRPRSFTNNPWPVKASFTGQQLETTYRGPTSISLASISLPYLTHLSPGERHGATEKVNNKLSCCNMKKALGIIQIGVL